MTDKRIAILGTVGVPARYGGFETLVENLIKYHDAAKLHDRITVYCSSKNYPIKKESYQSARLKYISLKANGMQSILYDASSLFSAAWNRYDVILLLGVSGTIVLPFIRLLSSARIITNIDGIEWRRDKWRGLAKYFLRLSEKMAVRYSDEVVSDNRVIADYVRNTYGIESNVIAYGGDHAIKVDSVSMADYDLPETYAFSVCRIEPENNIHIILQAFSRQGKYALILVGNWKNCDYGLELRDKYKDFANLYLLDPIYDLRKLKKLRSECSVYVHGHSAGGTNPSLVEAMHFGIPIIAFDCEFNRVTTEDKALYFHDTSQLIDLLKNSSINLFNKVTSDMQEIANRRYTWSIIAKKYFDLMSS